MSSKKRWREAGFKTAFEAKQAFASLIQSAIVNGAMPRMPLPYATYEYLGWLIAGHPRWPQWAANNDVCGYSYAYVSLSSDASEISQLCLTFAYDHPEGLDTYFQPFSAYEALHGELRNLEDRVRIAFAKEVKLLLSERVRKGAFVDQPIDYNHLDRLIGDYGATEYTRDVYEDPGLFSQSFPYHIVDRDFAAQWREFVRNTSSQWGDKK